MALNEQTINLGEATQYNRTWRTTIETPFGGMDKWRLDIHREDVTFNAGGDLIKRDANRKVTRKFVDVMTESVTLVSDPTKTLTIAEIAEAIELAVDKWTQEDIDAESNPTEGI